MTANTGYQIASVLMDGRLATPPYTFTNVNTAHMISATFQQVIPEVFPLWIIFTLLISATLAGTVILRRKANYQ